MVNWSAVARLWHPACGFIFFFFHVLVFTVTLTNTLEKGELPINLLYYKQRSLLNTTLSKCCICCVNNCGCCFVLSVAYLLVFHVCFVMFSWTYWKSIFTPPASPCKKVPWRQCYWFIILPHNKFAIWNKCGVDHNACCSSFSCHTQTSRDTRWRRGQTLRSKSWLRSQRNCPSLLELSLEVSSPVK